MNDIRDQLVWNRLLAIVEEQAQTLMRTAFSTVVREAGDLSAGVFDTTGAMLAQAVTGTPGHVNAMAASVGKFLARYPLATLAPGDVLVTNDPWDGTGHLNDFTVVTPVFDSDKAVALFAATSHIADVGGRGFGPDAGELFEEGLRIPIMKLFERGEENAALMRLIAANVRDPVVAEGDLHSLTACNHNGGRQLLAMLREFELDSFDRVGRWIIATSQRAMAEEIRALPDGIYRHAMDVDGYDQPVHLACALTIAGDAIDVDFAGSSGLSPYGINVPLNYTEAYASFGVRCVVGNDVPNNAGSLQPVTVRAPAGCILNAEFPAAVSARHAIGQMLPDVVLGCMDQVLPGVAPAEGASCIWNPVLRNAAARSAMPRQPPSSSIRYSTAAPAPAPPKTAFNHRIPVRRAHHAHGGKRGDRAARLHAARVPDGFRRSGNLSWRPWPSDRSGPCRRGAVRDLEDVRPHRASCPRSAGRRRRRSWARLH